MFFAAWAFLRFADGWQVGSLSVSGKPLAFAIDRQILPAKVEKA